MSELHLPKHVQLDLHPFYCYPDPADRLYSRIGVVTQVELGKDALCVKAGVSDDSTHDILAARIGPGRDQRMALPPEMYSKDGLAVTWYYPNMRDRLEGRAEVTLAIGLFVVKPPHEVLKQEDLSKIVVDETMLTEADKQFGRYITS